MRRLLLAWRLWLVRRRSIYPAQGPARYLPELNARAAYASSVATSERAHAPKARKAAERQRRRAETLARKTVP